MPTLTEVAVADMRRPGAVITDLFNWSSYSASYAPNDAGPSGRRIGNNSIQYVRAYLAMSKFPLVSEAWNPSINPDYPEISYVSPDDPVRQAFYGRTLLWNQLFFADPWGPNNQPAGWINNTRVMMWGFEYWMKSKSTGLWTRIVNTDTFDGQGESPNFSTGPTENFDYRIEPGTGYGSVRLVRSSFEPTGAGYYIFHGYSGGRVAIDPYDVADAIVVQRMSLVPHDTFYADDRDFARMVISIGADWYPASGSLPGALPSLGGSRHKMVTAKWPNWQFLVMHTMTEEQFMAPGGHPAVFDTIAEGQSGGGGGDPEPPLPQLPGRTSPVWVPLLDGSYTNWGSYATPTPGNKVRRRRRAK